MKSRESNARHDSDTPSVFQDKKSSSNYRRKVTVSAGSLPNMNSPKNDPADVTRERIIRQTPRPRISLSSSPSKDQAGASHGPSHGIDAVKVRNRFQHSQNNVLCYSSNISNQHQGNIQQSSSAMFDVNVKKTQPEESYSSNVPVASYSTMSADRGSTCSRCNVNAIVYEHNVKKCHNCGMFSLLRYSHFGSPLGTKSFYGKDSFPMKKKLMDPKPIESNAWKNTADFKPQNKPSQRRKATKQKTKDKVCLTISSDEEEDQRSHKAEEPESPATATSKEESARNQSLESSTETESYRIPKLSDRMKPQGGKSNQNTSPGNNSGLAIVRPSNLLTTTEQGFELNVSNVQLGSLPGKGTTPLSLKNNALRIEVECSFEVLEANKKKRMNEKYKLALSSVEVSQIIVNYESEPLVMSVIPTRRYSEIVNKALSKCILDAENSELIKRQIIFVIDSEKSVFKRTLEQTLPHLQRISPVSTYLNDDITTVITSIHEEADGRYATRSASAQKKREPPKVVKTLFVYPPPPKKGGIAITNVDIDCLQPGVYLNDIIIDFYLKYLYEEKLSPQQQAKTYIFNSYFYTRLSKRAFGDPNKNESPMQRMHTQVKKWTRDVNIFEKDFILIPINEHSHWFLVIICFPASVQLDESNESNGSSENASSDGIEEVPMEDKKNVEYDRDQPKQSQTEEKSEEKSGLENDNNVPEDLPMDVDTEKTLPEKMQKSDSDLKTEKLDTSILNKGHKMDNFSSNDQSVNDSESSLGSADNAEQEESKGHIVYEQPCILLFDSLVSGGRSRVFSNLRHYLTLEWKEKMPLESEKVFTKNNLKGSFPKTPLQNNDCDCGIYILQFAESFFQSPILNYKFPIKKEKWFTKAHVDSKRECIHKVITDLEQQYLACNASTAVTS